MVVLVQFKVYFVEYVQVVIVFGQVFGFQSYLAGLWCWWKVEVYSGGIELFDFDVFNFVELFLYGLCYFGFGCFCYKLVDGLFFICNDLLLVFISCQLLFVFFFVQVYIFVVGCFVVVDFVEFDFNCFFGDVVEKLFIVGNYDDCIGVIFQEFFQLDDGFDIQVVGWFVQQEVVGVLQQYFCQFDLYLLVVVEFIGQVVYIGSFEVQAGEYVFGICFYGLIVQELEVVVDFGEIFEQFYVRIIFVICMGCYFII